MAIEIFWGSGSGPSWRVLLTLAVKKLPFESRLLSFSNREHKSPEMLAMNPRGKVPVLRDESFTLFESLAIMSYLDRKYPATPLFGTSPESAGTIMRAIMEHECYGVPAISAATRPLLFGAFDDEKRKIATDALPALREELARLEAYAAQSAWLAGDALSAADIFVLPAVKTVERALAKPAAASMDHGLRPLSGALPKLAAWIGKMEAIPGYEGTYPPHWREG